MKIIEYIAQHGTGLHGTPSVPYDLSARFTCNNTGLTVQAVYDGTVAAGNFYLQNDSNHSSFKEYDNVLIESICITLPLNFQLYSRIVKMRVTYKDVEGNNIDIPGIGEHGILIPASNYEIPLQIMFSANAIGMSDTRRLSCQITEPDGNPVLVSMVDIPDVLNTHVFPLMAVLKITHNSPLE